MVKIKRVLELRNGSLKVENDDGTIVVRSGNWNIRNNNPGNLENGPFARSRGALDLTNAQIIITNPNASRPDRFAVFPDFTTGRAAKKALLFERSDPVGRERIVYKNSSIATAITTYAPPSENPTAAYINAIVRGLNNRFPNSVITVDTILNTLTDAQREVMLDIMQEQEGGNVQPTIVPDVASSGPSAAEVQTASANYFQRVYVDNNRFTAFANALNTNQIKLNDVSIKTLVEQSGVATIENLAGEQTLLSAVAQVQADSATAQENIANRLSGFTLSEQYFLLSQNYFELYPDRMRSQMSKNAGNGINANYSHAWRAPGKLAITANITIPGASGFRIGQIFWIGRTYESYKKYGAFQLFGLTENIDINRGWTTELYARYNAIPVSKLINVQSE